MPPPPRPVLFLAEAVTLAHVARLVSLGTGLDRKKYVPVFAWDPRYNGLIGNLPGEFHPISSLPSAEFRRRLSKIRPVYDLPLLENYVRDDLALIHAVRPAAVVGDFRLSLIVSARRAGVPFLNVVNAHWSPFARHPWPVPDNPITRFSSILGSAMLHLARPFLFRLFARPVDLLCRRHGIPSPGKNLPNVYSEGDRVLYPDLAEIVPTPGRPPHHCYLGPVTWSPSGTLPKGAESPSPGKVTVYLNFGSSGDPTMIPTVLSGLSSLAHRIIIGTPLTTRISNPAPDKMEIFQSDYISGEAACRVADLVINNGGVGGAHQALLAGKPLLGIPSNLDQFLSMHYLESAGIGLTLRPERLTPHRVAESAEKLLRDPKYIRRLQDLRQAATAYSPADTLNQVLDEVTGETGTQ